MLWIVILLRAGARSPVSLWLGVAHPKHPVHVGCWHWHTERTLAFSQFQALFCLQVPHIVPSSWNASPVPSSWTKSFSSSLSLVQCHWSKDAFLSPSSGSPVALFALTVLCTSLSLHCTDDHWGLHRDQDRVLLLIGSCKSEVLHHPYMPDNDFLENEALELNVSWFGKVQKCDPPAAYISWFETSM